jgi:hypothetical protein
MKRQENAEHARELLRQGRLSRSALELSLGISQQRVSEALRDIGAHVIGHEPRDRRGHPMPIYALDDHPRATEPAPIGRVSSVWQLGGVDSLQHQPGEGGR